MNHPLELASKSFAHFSADKARRQIPQVLHGRPEEFPDGCGLLRASSNLPGLAMRCEASSEQRLAAITALFKEKLKRYPQVSDKWDTSVSGT